MAYKYKHLFDDFFMSISDNNESEMIRMRNHAIQTCDNVIDECPYKYYLQESTIKYVLSVVYDYISNDKTYFKNEDNNISGTMIINMLKALKIYEKGLKRTKYISCANGKNKIIHQHYGILRIKPSVFKKK